MSTIKQEHTHLLAQRFKDGKWVKCCIHHECDYEEKDEHNDGADL